MDILFNEPTSARWFFVNPVTNIIHLLVPAVGGERAGTDNTCQTMMAMKTFFGKNAGEHAGALQEMELYRRALQQDIASISPQDQERRSIREQKQSRLQQIEKIIAALRVIQNTPEISQLNHVYPDYPPSVARLMEGSNVYSMLMPPVTDGYLYTKNRVFTVDRTRNDRFYGAMMLGFNNLVFGSQSPKEQVIRAAVRQLEAFRTQQGRDPGFPEIQAILTSVMKEKTGLDVDFSSSPTGAPITPQMLTNIHLEDNPSFRDTVEAWLDTCALELWSTLPISPFQSVNNPNLTAGKKKETLAIMLQFLLAEVNIYARSKDLSQRNFGQVLDENSTLRNTLITSVTGTLAQGGSIEQAVLEFINHNRQAFGLSRALNTADQKEIVDYFRSDWATIKDSPHFDEFTIWVDKPGKFVVHQGAICVDFAEVINSGFRNTVSQADLAYFDQARADYQSVNGKLNHTNPSTLASYTIDETRLPGYLLELIANTDNHEALSAILLARTAVRNEGQLQPGPKVFETLSAETVQALKRSPNWARLQNMIGSHITDPVTQTAFNAKFLGALQQINISNEQARALYTAVVKSRGPRAVTGYATTTELRQILTALGIGDQLNIGFNIQNGFSVTVRGEAYDNLVAMLNNYSDKIYITPEMARNFYLQVKERYGENSAQYQEMQALNNEGVLPAKMIKALSLLDINLVTNEHDEPEIDFPAGGVDGYILQIANPQRNLQLIENIQQQQTIFHLTPDIAGLLYQMVNSQGRGNEIASLTNNPSPDKIRQTLDILEISHGLIGFHGNNGYDIHLSPLARERLRMLMSSNLSLTGGGGRGSRGRGQAYRAATIPLPMTPVTNAPVAQPPVNPPAARTEPVLPPAAAPAPVNQISIEPVASFHATNLPANASRMDLNCPEPVLQAFRNLLRGEPILGCSFNNPYTHQVETLPSNADELTARHLQILARNERSNVTGIMNTGLYQGKLSDNKIARLRCLVKATNGAGIVQVNAYGGYPHGNPIHTYPSPRRMIVVDQAGLQWQSDFRNTGGMFFYPDNPADAHLPNGFANWQAESFRDMYGYQRPAAPENYRQISWYGVSGKLDLNLVANAISAEFLQAWHAVVAQGDELNQGELVCLKFLKAGMGFFAHGVPGADKPYLEHARLQGILQALQTIAALPENQRAAAIGRIGRLELPFSGNVQGGAANPPGYRDTLEQIGRVVTQLGLQWGGTPTDDVFVERQGFINACTNCADPHAMIGNEGGHASVDAAMASNANLDGLNAAYNPHMRLRPLPQGLALSHEISPETARALYTAVVNQNGPQAVTGYSSQQELERILTFLRFPDIDSIDTLEGNRFRVHFQAPAIARLQNILQNYQNSIYFKPEAAVSLYLAVKARFGENSDEYRTMQSLNNQGGNPAKIQKALELLGITVDRIRFPAGGGNGYIFEVSAENRQRLEAIPQQAPAPTAAIPATTTTTTTTTTAATPATVTPATTASVANQPTFFQPPPSSRPSATTEQGLSSNVVESLKVFMKQGARHMPRGSWAEIGTINGLPFEIGINRGGKYSLASSDYELSILENGDLELLSKNRRNANGRWQTVSGPEKIQVLNQFFRALPLNQLQQHFLLDSLQKLSALTSRSNFQRMSLRDACDRANIVYHDAMPENAMLDISPRTRQPCIDIGNERIELEQSRLDFAVRSLNTTAITPSRTQQAIGQVTDNLMVLRVAISTIPPEDTPATRIGNP